MKLEYIFAVWIFGATLVAQNNNIDHKLIKKYEYAHDLELPNWGPYSKKYNGISHITSKAKGYRFDLSFATGFFQRSKMVIPDVVEEQNYFIWDVDPDLKYLGYNYQLEWKDKVKCDIVFSEVDAKNRYISAKFTNNTESKQDVVYNLLASMNYPRNGKGGIANPVLPVNLTLPTSGIWVDGMDYKKMDYANPRIDDNLIYDAFAKGEVYGSGMVNARALGRNFGKDKGDKVEYYFKSDIQEDAILVFRYKTIEKQSVLFSTEGVIENELILEPSNAFRLKSIAVSKEDLG